MKTVIEKAKTKKYSNIIILDSTATPDDIIDALEDLSPFHSEEGNKPKVTKTQRKKLIKQKIAERNAEIRMKALNKFFE
jgi:hypothetical protein